MSTPLRRAIEQRSAVLLLRLRQLPSWVPLVTVLALVLAGLFLPGLLGATLLALVVLILGWLTYLAWPALSPNARLIRFVALGILVIAVARVATG